MEPTESEPSLGPAKPQPDLWASQTQERPVPGAHPDSASKGMNPVVPVSQAWTCAVVDGMDVSHCSVT